jgi:hypothetical protein
LLDVFVDAVERDSMARPGHGTVRILDVRCRRAL